jgi:lysophospholipase L1-like esterase
MTVIDIMHTRNILMIWNEILCLGDSITYGARDTQGRSFVAELGKILTEKTDEFYYCHNCGISGETSSDLLRRAWSNTSSNNNSRIATLLIGTNDTQIPITEEVYEDNLRQIISILKVHGMHIILCTLPELGFTPLYLKNKEYIGKYNKIIRKFAKDESISICDMSGTEKYYIDGVHYTHDGYKVLANKIANIILQEKKNV